MLIIKRLNSFYMLIAGFFESNSYFYNHKKGGQKWKSTLLKYLMNPQRRHVCMP